MLFMVLLQTNRFFDEVALSFINLAMFQLLSDNFTNSKLYKIHFLVVAEGMAMSSMCIKFGYHQFAGGT